MSIYYSHYPLTPPPPTPNHSLNKGHWTIITTRANIKCISFINSQHISIINEWQYFTYNYCLPEIKTKTKGFDQNYYSLSNITKITNRMIEILKFVNIYNILFIVSNKKLSICKITCRWFHVWEVLVAFQDFYYVCFLHNTQPSINTNIYKNTPLKGL